MKGCSCKKEKYPKKEKINKELVAAKLKSMRSGFRKVIDCSKRKGEGHVVFTFFDFCNDL